ncbi:MAG: glycosyltransferase 87 family protein [Actinomycetota bacterium]
MAIILSLAAVPVVWRYLIDWPQDQWQVDVEVYREAARSIVHGRPIYEHLTEPPQLLPFTYPPFAALCSLPLALLPFEVIGWLWTAAQLVAIYLTVLIAFRPMLSRIGPHWWLFGALLTAPMIWLQPVADGIRFGQVNAFIVLLAVADLAVRHPRWPRGLLIGIATAVKLTPGVFWVHFVVARRWGWLRTSIATAATATIIAAIVLPEATVAFWGGALSDPNRLGPNAGTSNQSLRGVLLRLGPDGTAGTVLWLIAVAAVGVAGFTVAARAHRAGNPVAQVAAVGLMAVLLSPVAWVHHLAWVIVVVAAVMGDGRSGRRLLLGGLVYTWFLLRIPWWGSGWVSNDLGPVWIGRVLQNGYCWGALLALVVLAWSVQRDLKDSAADRASELSHASA